MLGLFALHAESYIFHLDFLIITITGFDRLLGSSLLLDETSIDPIGVLRKEFGVISRFYNFAFVHHKDAVSVLNGRQSVSNDEGSDLTEFFSNTIDGLLDFGLILAIESRSRFIKKKNFGLFDEGLR